MTMGRGVLAMITLAACVSCAADAAPTRSSLSFDDVNAEEAGEMPPSEPFEEGRSGPNGEFIFTPVSADIEDGVAYRFNPGHCGLHSPVDIDGSFWDELDGLTANGQPLDLEGDPEMINATAGVVVVIGDEARFRTETRSVVRFARHEGDKDFPGCM